MLDWYNINSWLFLIHTFDIPIINQISQNLVINFVGFILLNNALLSIIRFKIILLWIHIPTMFHKNCRQDPFIFHFPLRAVNQLLPSRINAPPFKYLRYNKSYCFYDFHLTRNVLKIYRICSKFHIRYQKRNSSQRVHSSCIEKRI